MQALCRADRHCDHCATKKVWLDQRKLWRREAATSADATSATARRQGNSALSDATHHATPRSAGLRQLTGARNLRESNLQEDDATPPSRATIAGCNPRPVPGPPGRQLATGSQPSVHSHLA
jgi:hypothetical protein